MVDLLSCFPSNFTPSKQQENLLNEISKAFKDGYKFVVCSAPTGSGKSFISKTLANAAKSCDDTFKEQVDDYSIYKMNNLGKYQNDDTKPFGAFALTITKTLQDQYKSLFDDVSILKGKSNYQCEIDPSYSVEHAPCLHLKKLKEDCWKKNICPYYNARNETIKATFSSLNYNMFFALPEHVKRKEYIICDEAAELEDQLVKEFTCHINFEFLKKSKVSIRPVPNSSEYNKIGRWLNMLCLDIEDRVDDLKEIINKGKKKDGIGERKNELSSLMKVQSKIKTLIETWNDSEYLIERQEKGIVFTPLKVDKLSQYIFKHGQKIVLMSATIIDPQNFCKVLGITKFKYVEAQSTFDASKAPIYIATKTKLNHSNLQQNLPKILKQIKDICKHHEGEKGIIHSQTHAITSYIKQNFYSKRLLFREPGITNEDLIDQHTKAIVPTVIVSPSMSHGVDLKDDLARFQIIIKAPYLPLTDKRVKQMMSSDFDWYKNKMLGALIQACGRGVRSPKDHCATYILDGAIAEAVLQNKHKIPKYFIDRFM